MTHLNMTMRYVRGEVSTYGQEGRKSMTIVSHNHGVAVTPGARVGFPWSQSKTVLHSPPELLVQSLHAADLKPGMQ